MQFPVNLYFFLPPKIYISEPIQTCKYTINTSSHVFFCFVYNSFIIHFIEDHRFLTNFYYTCLLHFKIFNFSLVSLRFFHLNHCVMFLRELRLGSRTMGWP